MEVNIKTNVKSLGGKQKAEIKNKMYNAIKEEYPEKIEVEIIEDVERGMDSRLSDLTDTIELKDLKTLKVK